MKHDFSTITIAELRERLFHNTYRYATNPMNLLSRHERAKASRGKRDYLTIDEVKRLIATPCRNETVRNAYLFACNCGLRLGDVRKLRWGDIAQDNGGKHDAGSLVFEHLPGDTCINNILKTWAADAGITKSVTYHQSRHTFATMLLTLGADLYTVCKLLGHSDVKTTRIYAKIINKKKEDAIGLIDMEFANT